MKTISARQFRLNFQELTEPVQVQRRRGSGEYEIVGTWSPAIPYKDTWAEVPIVNLGQNATPADVARVRATFRPVPKPGKR